MRVVLNMKKQPSTQKAGLMTEHDDIPILNGRKAKITDSRRVWGTLSVCTPTVLKGVIEICCGIRSVRA